MVLSWTINVWNDEIASKHQKQWNYRKNGKNVLQLEITEIVLVHCNIVSNDYQHDSKVLYPFVPNKSIGQFLVILLLYYIFSRIFNS